MNFFKDKMLSLSRIRMYILEKVPIDATFAAVFSDFSNIIVTLPPHELLMY